MSERVAVIGVGQTPGKRSRKDVEAGRIHELKNIEELDEVWA